MYAKWEFSFKNWVVSKQIPGVLKNAERKIDQVPLSEKRFKCIDYSVKAYLIIVWGIAIILQIIIIGNFNENSTSKQDLIKLDRLGNAYP